MSRFARQFFGENGVIYEAGTTALTGLDVCRITCLTATEFTTLTNRLAVSGVPGELPRSIFVSGTLTDGTNPVVFPELLFAGLSVNDGSPIYTSDGLTPAAQYACYTTEGLWLLTDGGVGGWQSSDSPIPSRPEQVETWDAAVAYTGTPVITSGETASPTGVTIPAGVDLFGRFSAVTLASGAVALYKAAGL